MQNVWNVKCKYLGFEDYTTKDSRQLTRHNFLDHVGNVFSIFKDFTGEIGKFYELSIVSGQKREDGKYKTYVKVTPYYPENIIEK